jgi:hypothetical protein
MLRKNSLIHRFQRFCNKGLTSVRPIRPFESTLGFTGCGKTHESAKISGFVSGPDFSQADKASQINVGL